jgi:hypothetical protein
VSLDDCWTTLVVTPSTVHWRMPSKTGWIVVGSLIRVALARSCDGWLDGRKSKIRQSGSSVCNREVEARRNGARLRSDKHKSPSGERTLGRGHIGLPINDKRWQRISMPERLHGIELVQCWRAAHYVRSNWVSSYPSTWEPEWMRFLKHCVFVWHSGRSPETVWLSNTRVITL